MTQWITLALTVIGWVTVSWFNRQAQRANLRNQVMDRARGEIVERIRKSQRWLSAYESHIRAALISAEVTTAEYQIDWNKKADELAAMSERTSDIYEWAGCLEEYLILFPSLREVWREMGERHRDILFLQVKWSTTLIKVFRFHTATTERVSTLRGVVDELTPLGDYAALLEDIRIHVQNASLGEITGNTIPKREPLDPTVPRMVVGPYGMWKIGTGK